MDSTRATGRLLRIAALLAVTSMLGGCAAGVGGLIALIFATGGGDEAAPDPIVNSVKPRQSAVVGGVQLTLEGRNFDGTTTVSFGGVPGRDVRVISSEELTVVVPHNDLEVSAGQLDPLYTDTNPSLRMQVSNAKRTSFAPFWYMRPRLRELYELDLASQRQQAYGHRSFRQFAYLEGDFFAFTNRDLSRTKIRLLRRIGTEDVEMAVLGQVDAPSDPTSSPDGTPGFWVADSDCPVLPCLDDPHQGREVRIRLPVQAEVSNPALFISGPYYVLSVENANGVDEVDIGYAPPYPPVNISCSVETISGSPAVRVQWEENPLNAPDFFDIVFVERFDPGSGTWVPLMTVPSGTGSFVDSTVGFTNYVFRVYGRINGDDSPAITCEVPVLPPGKFDFVLDLGGLEKPLVPLATLTKAASSRRTSPGLAPRTAPGGAVPTEAAPSLVATLEAEGRPAFLLRELRNVDDLAVDLSGLLDSELENVEITWITSGDGARFGVPSLATLKGLLRYHEQAGGGGIYVEGQHVVAAIEAAVDADPVIIAGSGPGGIDSSELEQLLIQRRLGAFDPRLDLGTYDRMTGVTVEGSPSLGTLDWGENGADDSVSAYERADAVLERLAAAGGSVLLRGQATLAEAGAEVSRDAVAAVFLSRQPDDAAAPLRTLLSLLQVDGFTSESQRRALVTRYVELLGGARAAIPPLPGRLLIDPPEARWDVPSDISISSPDGGLGRVEGVRFGGTPAEIISRSDSLMSVRAPAGQIPGSRPVVLDLSPGDSEDPEVPGKPRQAPAAESVSSLVIGSFRFTAGDLELIGPYPDEGPVEGGTIVDIAGSGFTVTPDLKVFFAGVPAPITRVTPTLVTCVAPPAREVGSVEILVRTGEDEREARSSFFYCSGAACGGGDGSAPVIVSVSGGPTGSALGGARLTIRGRNFIDGTVALVCGEPLVSPVITPGGGDDQLDELTGETPPGCGLCDLVVASAAGRDTLREAFVYRWPEILDVRPNTSPPSGGGTMSIDIRYFDPELTVLTLCETRLEVSRATDLGQSVTRIEAAIPRGEGSCDLEAFDDLDAPSGVGCGESVFPDAMQYGIPVLSLGTFTFDEGKSVPDDEGEAPASRLGGILSAANVVVDDVEYPPVDSITARELRGYAMVVFSDLEPTAERPDGRLTQGEANEIAEYVWAGGILVLLGQQSVDVERLDVPCRDSADRNLIAREFGFEFGRNVLCDPRRHVEYDGCRSLLLGCEKEPIDAPAGDPDGGEEYPVLLVDQATLKEFQGDFPRLGTVFRDVANVMFNSGQTIEVLDQSSSLVLELLRGTSRSYGDSDPKYVEEPDGCRDGWFVNTYSDDVDGRQSVVGAVVAFPYESSGMVIAIGDQELFWDAFIQAGCLEVAGAEGTESISVQHEQLVRNLAQLLRDEFDA